MRRTRIGLLMGVDAPPPVTQQEMLETAISYVDGLLVTAKADPDTNPAYITSWEKTRLEWAYMLDRGEVEMGLKAAVEKARHLCVECGDWFENTGDPRYARLSDEWSKKRKEWGEAL